ncbi:MAG: DEAD/DEAH box helicase family protein, partial [Chloroflexi bacterium]|nr:DEAD/DEAH box helicase family protein [Chloroflexota bacterium]
MMTPEQAARRNIDAALGQAGWTVQDANAVNLWAGRGVVVREFPLKGGHGFADYLLYVDGQAIGIVEAKPEGSTLTGVVVQAARYSEGLPAHVPAPVRPLPFLYQSTGVETRFTNRLDPDPRSRQVFHFHRPETLAGWVDPEGRATAAPTAQRAAESSVGYGSTLRGRMRTMPPLDETGLWPAQVTAIRNLERSLAEDRPRALVQMATGSGKTFTAITSAYRLIKFAGVRRVLFLVDRANLGRQTLKEFQQYSTPDDGRKFTELYNVQHLQTNRLDPVARVCITTIQRLYAMPRGDAELDPALEEGSQFDTGAGLVREPAPVAYNPLIPIETFDVAFGSTDPDLLSSLAGRLARLDRQLGAPERQALAETAGGTTLRAIAAGLVQALDPDHHVEAARAAAGLSEDAEPTPDQVAQAAQRLLQDAAAPLATNATLRNQVVEMKQRFEQTLDTVSQDLVLEAAFSVAAREKASSLVATFEQFIREHKDEITALQVLYSRPYAQRLRLADIKALALAIKAPPRAWTPEALWRAYETLDLSKVRGSGGPILTDIVA